MDRAWTSTDNNQIIEKESSDGLIDWTLFINLLCWRNVRKNLKIIKHASSEILFIFFYESRMKDWLSMIEDIEDS